MNKIIKLILAFLSVVLGASLTFSTLNFIMNGEFLFFKYFYFTFLITAGIILIVGGVSYIIYEE